MDDGAGSSVPLGPKLNPAPQDTVLASSMGGGLKEVKTQRNPHVKVGGDEDYAVSPRAPLLATELQNNAYLCGEARYGQLGSGMRPVSHNRAVPSPQPSSVAGDNSWAVISLGSFHVAAITSQGKLYTWGLNSKGQCGVVEPDPADKGRITYYPGPARVKSSTTGGTYKAVACGGEHTIALGSRGVCAWGDNSRGQLGLGLGTQQIVWRPQLLPSLGRISITQLVCGSQHSLALTAQSQVLAWGANDQGQLGCGDTVDRHTPAPVEGLWGLPITRLAAGDKHSLALTTTGQLYAWGSNSYGQCGVVVEVVEEEVWEPEPEPITVEPAQAAPPAAAPAARQPPCDPQLMQQWRDAMLCMGITNERIDMSLHVTGWRGVEVALEWLFSQEEHDIQQHLDHWRLLQQQLEKQAQAAAQTQTGTRRGGAATSAAAVAGPAAAASAALSGTSDLAEGRAGDRAQSSRSRLSRSANFTEQAGAASGSGMPDLVVDENVLLVPTEVHLPGVRHMSAGVGFSVAVLEHGDVFSWGMGSWGSLGHGDLEDKAVPTWVEGLQDVVAERVSCGQYHTIVVSRDGQVYGCGRCELGQLGVVPQSSLQPGDNTTVSRPIQLALTAGLIEQVAAAHASPFTHTGNIANGSTYSYSDGQSDSDKGETTEAGSSVANGVSPSPSKTIMYSDAPTVSPTTARGVVLHVMEAGGCNTAILLRRHQEAPSPGQVTLLAKLQAAVARALALQNAGLGPNGATLALALRHVAKGASLVLGSPAALCAALAIRPRTHGLSSTLSIPDPQAVSNIRTPLAGQVNPLFGAASSTASSATTPRKRPRGGASGSPFKSQGPTPRFGQTGVSTGSLPAPLALPLDISLLDQLYCNLMELSGVTKDPAPTGSLTTEYDQGPAMCELQRYGLQQALLRCGLTLCEDLMVHAPLLRTPERAQVLLAALHCPLLADTACCKQLLPKLCHAVLAAPAASRRLLVRWWASYPPELLMERLVAPMQAYITKELAAVKKLTSSIMAVIKVLARVEAANQLAGGLLPPEAFYNTLISEKMDVQDHYSAWRTTQDLGGGLPGARPVTNTSGLQLYACEADSDPDSPHPVRTRVRGSTASTARDSNGAAQQQPVVQAAVLAPPPVPAGRQGSRSGTPSPPGRASDTGSEVLLDTDQTGGAVTGQQTGMRMSDPGRAASGHALPPLSAGTGLPPAAAAISNRRSTLTGSSSEVSMLQHRRSSQPLDVAPSAAAAPSPRGPSPSRGTGTPPAVNVSGPVTLPPLPSPLGGAGPTGARTTSRAAPGIPQPPRSVTPPAARADSNGRRLSNSGARNPYTDFDERMPPRPRPAHRMSEPGTGPLPLPPAASRQSHDSTQPSPPPGQASTQQGSSTPLQPTAPRPVEPGPFSFCTYPFLLDARAKSNLLHIEARFQMEQTVAHARMEQQLYSQHARFNRGEPGRRGRASEPGTSSGAATSSSPGPSTSQEEDLMLHVLDKVTAAEDDDEEWGAVSPTGSTRSASASGAAGSGSAHGRSRARPTKGFRGLLAALLRHGSIRSSSANLDDEPGLQVDARAESFKLPRPRECTMPGTHSDMCILRVRRTHLVEDALDEITRQARRDLFKPLRVHFIGEDGIDAGGVKKEFFALLLAELLRPEFGLMEGQPDSNTYWFPKHSVCQPHQYQLLGLVLGLAVYNRVLLDFPLPMAAYKKLLGLPVGLRDLEEMCPPVGKSLRQLLEIEGPPGTIEDLLCLTWAVDEVVWGQHKVVELVPGGEDIPVTEENREAYVEARVEYHLHASISWQFDAFARGFGVLCNGPAMRLFNAAELERLVCGNPLLDWAALQKNAKYEGGYTASSLVVVWLWDIVRNELPLDEKKRFLKFFTGSDRAPIGGLGTLRCILQRAGPDSDRLPTSHTCFNTLLLPEYMSRTKLARQLRTAINNAEGFGLE